MKGPSERLKYDLQRIWECPVCHGRVWSSGATTTQVCACQAKRPLREVVCMQLVADGVRRASQETSSARSDAADAASAESLPCETTPDTFSGPVAEGG